MVSRLTSLTVAIFMVARQFMSPVSAYTRPKKANIDSNSQHPSMKRVGFKKKEDMRSLTNRGFNLDQYTTGCKVDENGYYKGCKYTEQGISIWPTIAYLPFSFVLLRQARRASLVIKREPELERLSLMFDARATIITIVMALTNCILWARMSGILQFKGRVLSILPVARLCLHDAGEVTCKA